MRNLTNDYHDAQVLDLGSLASRGPFLVVQTGVAPSDEIPKTHMFVLRPDGQWVDFNAYACQGKPEAMDDIVFPTMTKVMEVFARLSGRPRVVDMPVDEDGLKAWIARQEDGNTLRAAQAWAADYKGRRAAAAGRSSR
ncbi:MAG: hypothetical protein ACJ8M1_04605 [Chthoniobacterales bacterium]